MVRAATLALVASLAACTGCGGESSTSSADRATNQPSAERSSEGAGGETVGAADVASADGVTLGEGPVPREQFAMGVAMISARRLCGTQRVCFVGMTPARCVRELGDAALAYAIEGADLPDPVPAERQQSFVDRELQPLAMLVFAQHAEAGQRECGPTDVLEGTVVVRPLGCVRLESDPTPCGR